MPLHGRDVQIGAAIGVVVKRRCVARPCRVNQARRNGHIGETAAAEVVVENRDLGAFRVQMAGERIAEALPQTVGIALLLRVLADVGDKQVEQSVSVVVEKHRAR